MPAIEVRVIDYDALSDRGFMEALDDIRPDFVSIGSESCYRQLPPLAVLDALFAELSSYDTKFVVPVLFESHFDAVRPWIDRAVGMAGTLVVNDYGVLQLLHDEYAGRLTSVALGSGISYSYEECPWNNHIVRDEPEVIKRAMLKSNLENEWMLELLEGFRLNLEAEIPALPGMAGSAAGLRRRGIRVSVLREAIPVSYSRACHAARFFGVPVQRCERVCRKAATLTPTARWDFFEGDVKEIRPMIKRQMPQLVVWGNHICVRGGASDTAPELDAADTIVFDYRFYDSPVDLRRAISGIRTVASVPAVGEVLDGRS